MSFRRNKKRNGGKRPARIFGCRILKHDLVETLVSVIPEIMRLFGKFPAFDGVGKQRMLAAFQSANALLNFYARLFDNKIIMTTGRHGEYSMILGTDIPSIPYRKSLDEACARVGRVYQGLCRGEDVKDTQIVIALGCAQGSLICFLRLLRQGAVRVTFSRSTPKNCFFPTNAFCLDSELRKLFKMIRLAPSNGRNKTDLVLDFIGTRYRHYHRVLSDLRLGTSVDSSELQQAMEFGDIMATAFFAAEHIRMGDIWNRKNHFRRLPTLVETPSLLH